MKTSLLTLILFLNFGSIKATKQNNQIEDPIVSSWRIWCTNYLTDLDIADDNTARLSLYSFNLTYINVQISKSIKNPKEYEIRFKNIDSQTIYYEDKKKINEDEISKTNVIATFTVKKNKLTLKWIGLYNLKTKSLEFVDDAVFVRENEGKNPIVFNRCKE